MKRSIESGIVFITPRQFDLLGALAQGDATMKELREKTQDINIASNIQRLRKKLGAESISTIGKDGIEAIYSLKGTRGIEITIHKTSLV